MKFIASILLYSLMACQNNASTTSSTQVNDHIIATIDTPVVDSDTFLVVEETLKQDSDSVVNEESSKSEDQTETKDSNKRPKTVSSKTIEVSQRQAEVQESSFKDQPSGGGKASVHEKDPKPVQEEGSDASLLSTNSASEQEEVKVIDTESNTHESIDDTPAAPKEVVTLPVALAVDHGDFHQLLQRHVSASGVVDYPAFKKDEAKLDEYLSHLSDHLPATSWSDNKGLAYWMNAYNAATIKLILKNYPVKSITDLHGGKPWDQSWIKLGGQSYSLNDIEHKIIRPTYQDARIHFAVNCAAKSCPPIWNQAFTEANVDSALTKLTKQFVNSSANQVSQNSLTLSKIFEWYAEDFGEITDFISQYSSVIVSPDAAVSHLEYDWSLNGK